MFRRSRPTSILFASLAISLTGACASTAGRWSNLVQSPVTARRDGVVPGSRDRIAALQPGSPLAVTLNSGGRLEGAFKAIEPAALALVDRAGKEFTIPMSEIDRIVAPGTTDSLTNGIALGAGIGAGAALAILAALGSGNNYVLSSAKVAAPLLLSSVGALAGAFVDRAHKTEEIVYRSR